MTPDVNDLLIALGIVAFLVWTRKIRIAEEDHPRYWAGPEYVSEAERRKRLDQCVQARIVPFQRRRQGQ